MIDIEQGTGPKIGKLRACRGLVLLNEAARELRELADQAAETGSVKSPAISLGSFRHTHAARWIAEARIASQISQQRP
jgi:hypothetical protein